MSRFGWMYANSAISGAVANGPTNSIQINSGAQILTGTSNFTYDPVTNTITLAGLMTGSSLVISASVISASTYLGIVGGGGSSTPGGTNNTVQFNSGSTFGGSTKFTYDTNTLTLSGALSVSGNVSINGGGTFIATTISGTTAQFTTITASNALVSNISTISNYLELKPVSNPNIPVNSSSYIYTSGSTNDMYFTQYGGGYTNTTRLRWLEGALSTGVLYGGLLTTVTGTNTFNVGSGSGIIVSYNASLANEPYPTVQYVSWGNFVSQSLIYSGSSQVTYVSIDNTGAILQNNVPVNPSQYKDRIVLGRILHLSGAVTTGFTSSPSTGYAVSSNGQDFFRSFGPLKVSGHVLAASGSTLSITKTTGDSYVEGRNYSLDANIPNYILAADDYAVTATKIYYQYVSGSTTIIDSGVGNAGYSAIIPNKYVVNGILTTISPTNNKFTIQRIYWFPRSSTRALYAYYGNTIYSTIDEALLAVATEPLFIEGENTKASAIYVGAVVLEADTSDLTITTKARIVQGGLFRGSGVGSGGGGSSTTPPGGTTHTVQYNDTGAFNGSTSFTYDTTTLALTGAFNVNGNVSINGGGILSGSTALFTTITGSTVTGSTALFTTITGSAYSGGSFGGTTVSGTAAQFTSITASAYSSSGDIQTGGGLTAFGNVATQGNVQAQGAIAGRYRTFAGNFTVATNSWFCAINSSGAAVTASLGLANTYYPGQQITFKDVGGFAAVSGKGILIQASGSDKIDGASSLVISATSGSVTLISDGSGSFYITSIV